MADGQMKHSVKRQILASVLLIVFIASPPSAGGLTTFGKSNPQNNNPPPPPTPVGNARACTTEGDCAGIKDTSCMAEQKDGKTRCLCGDYSPPVNGRCKTEYKAVRMPCNEDDECVDGAHCMVGNNTMYAGKRCYCKSGYYEENMMCNGASSIVQFSLLSFLLSLIFLL